MKSTKATPNNIEKQSPDELQGAAFLVSENASLKEVINSLKNRVAWFENQMFGQKSEKRIIENPLQGSLLGSPAEAPPEKETELKKVAEHTRGKAKKNRPQDCATESGLRFSDDVSVEIIDITQMSLKVIQPINIK
jgi:transposase